MNNSDNFFKKISMLKLVQPNLFKRPPLLDDHLSKMTSAESTQSNSHKIITVQDDQLSNATSDHFFLSPK